jgi:DNA-binding Lrp family transcriptional regulator
LAHFVFVEWYFQNEKIRKGETMDRRVKINENEAKILNLIGRDASLSHEEMAKTVGYKRVNTISKKLKKFEKSNILRGPYCDLNLSGVGKNQIHSVFSTIAFDVENRDFVFQILKEIPGVRWIYPSTDLDRFFAYFQVNHYKHIGGLLKILSRKNLIQYNLFSSKLKWIVRNPDFFGDPVPTSRNLLDDCNLPDISYKQKEHTAKWNDTDLIVMQYLQVLSNSPMEIARREYAWHRNLLTYNQIKYSIQKIRNNNIIASEDYHIAPLPREKCITVLLLLVARKKGSVLRVMENYGRGCRLHKTYTLAGRTGLMFLWIMPEAATNLLSIFDEIEGFRCRMLFLRSHDTSYLSSFSFEPRLFNIDSQRWEYPYVEVQKRIESALKKREKV